MKKYFTSIEFKRRNTRRSLDSINKLRKNKKKTKHYSKPNNVSNFGMLSRLNWSPPPIVPIKAPENFSLIKNTEETIKYFNSAHDQLKKSNRILFDISEIKSLTTDAIAVQIAKIKDEKFNLKKGIFGNAPNNPHLNQLFVQSGFYEYVNTRGPKPINDKKILIHKITNNRVEPDIAKDACLLGLRHTFQNEEPYEPLYNIIIEIMQNTNNHAGKTRGIFDWWLHVYNHPNSTDTSYTFLDLGVGIFESLPVISFKHNVLGFLGFKSNLDLIPKLVAGEIKSRTSRPDRGKGIPQIFECTKDKAFRKFILISNDVYADFKNQEYKLIKTPFIGTLYHWVLTKKN